MTDKRKKRVEQYMLRVTVGSHLEWFLDTLLDGEYHDKDEIKGLYGTGRGPWLLNRLAEWCDNMTCDDPWGAYKQRIRYIDVRAPTIVQSIKQAEFKVVDGPQESDEVCEIVWPDAPPLISRDSDFISPSYYDEMKAMVEHRRHISFEGPSGTGKSTSVEQLAAECGVPLVNVGGEAGLRKRDMIGSPEMVNGTTKFLVSEYAAAAVFGWWVKIDEANSAEADALMLLNGNLAPPFVINIHGRQYPIHPNFRVFITYNHGYVGTKPLSQSLKDRFYPIKVFFPSRYMLKKILMGRVLSELDDGDERGRQAVDDNIEAVLDYAQAMWDANQSGQLRYQISPRRLIDALFLVASGIVPDVKSALIKAVINVIDFHIEWNTAKQILDRAVR